MVHLVILLLLVAAPAWAQRATPTEEPSQFPAFRPTHSVIGWPDFSRAHPTPEPTRTPGPRLFMPTFVPGMKPEDAR